MRVGWSIEHAKLGIVVWLRVFKDHCHEVFIKWLLDLHIDSHFFIELVVAFEDWDHWVVQQATLVISLTGGVLLQELFEMTCGVELVERLSFKNSLVSDGSVRKGNLLLRTQGIILDSQIVLLLHLRGLYVLRSLGHFGCHDSVPKLVEENFVSTSQELDSITFNELQVIND